MDEVDIAQKEIEHALLSYLHAAGKLPRVEARGICLNCGESVEDFQRWCDSGCRDDWTRLHPRSRRLG